jgi:hypothetical protein
MTRMMGVCCNQSLEGSCGAKPVWQDPNRAMRLVNEIINRGSAMFRDTI